jgi:hypothetical protein
VIHLPSRYYHHTSATGHRNNGCETDDTGFAEERQNKIANTGHAPLRLRAHSEALHTHPGDDQHECYILQEHLAMHIRQQPASSSDDDWLEHYTDAELPLPSMPDHTYTGGCFDTWEQQVTSVLYVVGCTAPGLGGLLMEM